MLGVELKARRLSDLYQRWMDLRSKFPLVTHCCATQESPVFIDFDGKFANGPSVELSGSVFDSETRLVGNCSIAGLKQLSRDQQWRLMWSLYRFLWRSISMKPLHVLDRVFSHHFDDQQGSPISFPNTTAAWFGNSVFTHEWDDFENGVIGWFEHVAPLAVESLEICGDKFHRSHRNSRALETWLSHVYRIIDTDSLSSEMVYTEFVDLDGAVVTDGETERIIRISHTERVTASVATSIKWLPADVCTASMQAIEKLLDAPIKNVELKNTGDDVLPLQRSDETPIPTDYQYDGEWLTAGTCKERFGLDDSRLSTWARNGCDYLNGRQLRRETFPPDQRSYCYHRVDIEQISNARDEKRHENSCDG